MNEIHEILSTLEFLKELREMIANGVYDEGDLALMVDELDDRILDLERLLQEAV